MKDSSLSENAACIARRHTPNSVRFTLAIISIALCLCSRSLANTTFKADLNADGILETVTVGVTSVQIASSGRPMRQYKISQWNYYGLAKLDDLPGEEIYFTNLRTIQGAGQPSQASVISYAANIVKTHDVGRPNRVQLRELDGEPGLEMIFSNLWTINGVPQPAEVTVISSRKHSVARYDVQKPNFMQFGELNSRPGEEMLFTNVRTINGSAQPAKATLVIYLINLVATYDVGRPNFVQLHELDGYAGLEAVFTNLWLIQGVAQPAQVSVLNGRKRILTTSQVPAKSAGYLQFADLDGRPGDEMLFTNLRLIQGVAQPCEATIVETREGIAKTFNVGSPYTWNISDVSPAPGNEVVFTRATGRFIISSADFLP